MPKWDRFESIGGLWVKKGKKGDYLRGFIKLPDGSEMNIHILINTHKTGPTLPDYHIFRTKVSVHKDKRAARLKAREKAAKKKLGVTEGEPPCSE